MFYSYWIRSQRFMDAYAKGLTSAQAVWATRRYHGHRRLPLRILQEIENATILS